MSAVRGWVAAPGGEPLGGAKAQICIRAASGEFLCQRPVDTNEEGVFTVDVLPEVQCLDKVAMSVSLPGTGRATAYCLMDPNAGPGVWLDQPIILPHATPAIALPPVGNPDEAREVTFDDGLVLEVTPSLYFNSADRTYEEFGARRVPTDAVGLCGDAGSFDGLYAFYPEGVVSGAGYPLRIPNTTSLQAGAAVELFVLGGLTCKVDGALVPEAEWAKFGEGTVSDDGTTIDSAPGAGLPCFTWLGYRVKETP
jgi:hypothetical protein